MAARKLRIHHQTDIRIKIQAGVIVDRLQQHIAGKIELSSTQVAACKVLLDKSISNAPTEISGPDGGALRLEVLVADRATLRALLQG